VWKVFNPLLSPIVTPDKLELPPLRELNQLCDSLGYFVKVKVSREKKGTMEHVVLSVQLPDAKLVRDGMGLTKKSAKGEAAFRLLKDLEVCYFCMLLLSFISIYLFFIYHLTYTYE
jgi:endoribonuclease Dicer